MDFKIQFENVSFEYEKGKQILKDISFGINDSETVGITGSNGTGKSTLVKLLLGLEQPICGNISVCGMQVCSKNLKAIRQKAGYVMQDADNMLFMTNVYDEICFAPKNYKMTPSEIKKRADHAMKTTGCEYLKDKSVFRLSGGEKKLVSVAAILAMNPEIVIMDEPENNLDCKNSLRLRKIIQELPATKIIISHNTDFIWEVTDKVLILSEGGIAAFGKTKEILSDELLLERYSLSVPKCATIEKLKRQIEAEKQR